MKQIVVIESPYAATSRATVTDHTEYACSAMLDSIARGEVPLAGHLLYTQCLNDAVAEDRAKGIELHCHLIKEACDFVAVYQDLGISQGMEQGIAYARRFNVPVEFRTLKEGS